jgi:hypothetical protein
MLEKIIVKVAGGIGNQLFQVAFAMSLGRKFGAQVEVDDSSFVNYSYHHELEILKIGLPISKHDRTANKIDDGVFVLREGITSSLSLITGFPEECKTLVLEGYWQSEEYIDYSVIEALYRKLQTKYESNLESYIANSDIFSNGLAIHIRRRDYTHMGVASEEYYLAAADYICDRFGVNHIALFSDEPNYSHHFLTVGGVSNIHRISTGDDWLDLYIMSQFKNIIIGNSTYSWWGAFFGESRKRKRIICPDPWILVDSSVKPCPKRWMKIGGAVEPRLINQNKRMNFLENLRSCGSDFFI